MQVFELDDQLCWFDPDSSCGKTSQEHSLRENHPAKISASFWKKSSELSAVPYQFLDLTPGAGNLLGESYWETLSPYVGGSSTLNYVKHRIIQLMESWALWKRRLRSKGKYGIATEPVFT